MIPKMLSCWYVVGFERALKFKWVAMWATGAFRRLRTGRYKSSSWAGLDVNEGTLEMLINGVP